MADDDTQPATPAQTDDSEAAGTNDPKPGVSIPSWMAAALVVVLGLAIGLAGFAVGRATDDGGGRQFQPIGAQAPGGGGGDGELPFPGGQGGPGDQRGPGGEGGPGLPGGQRGERGEQRDGDEAPQDDGDQTEDQDQDQSEGL